MKPLIDLCKFNFPSGTYFSKSHTWIRKNEYDLIKLGIDEILCRMTEEQEIVNFAKVGTY